MKLTFLGTSSTLGIPRQGCQCLQCQSRDPRDKRTRTAAMINGKILIDAGPDIIGQLEREKIAVAKIEAILLTHRHSDAAGGLEKLKVKSEKLKVFEPEPRRTEIDNIEIQAFRVPHYRGTTVGFLICP